MTLASYHASTYQDQGERRYHCHCRPGQGRSGCPAGREQLVVALIGHAEMELVNRSLEFRHWDNRAVVQKEALRLLKSSQSLGLYRFALSNIIPTVASLDDVVEGTYSEISETYEMIDGSDLPTLQFSFDSPRSTEGEQG